MLCYADWVLVEKGVERGRMYLQAAAFAGGDARSDVFLAHRSYVRVIEIELVHRRVVHQHVCDKSGYFPADRVCG